MQNYVCKFFLLAYSTDSDKAQIVDIMARAPNKE